MTSVNTSNTSLCDAAEPWQIGLQDPATSTMEGMTLFHDLLLFFLIIIGFTVCWMLVIVCYFFNEQFFSNSQKFTHSSILEIVWTIIPAFILLFIAYPSFTLLYSLEEIINPSITLKIIGHQWYWSYEYSDYATSIDIDNNLYFDSYMLPQEDLTIGSFRLLEVDNRVILPTNVHLRLLFTADDVLHSWAVPSLGVKVDACPGRLSETSLNLKRPGVFYGQCSEICGSNHGFMPIVLKGVELTKYLTWLSLKGINICDD